MFDRLSFSSVLKLKVLGVVVRNQKIASTTTATNYKDLFRISSLQLIFINGLSKRSLMSIVLIDMDKFKSLYYGGTQRLYRPAKYTRAN